MAKIISVEKAVEKVRRSIIIRYTPSTKQYDVVDHDTLEAMENRTYETTEEAAKAREQVIDRVLKATGLKD